VSQPTLIFAFPGILTTREFRRRRRRPRRRLRGSPNGDSPRRRARLRLSGTPGLEERRLSAARGATSSLPLPPPRDYPSQTLHRTLPRRASAFCPDKTCPRAPRLPASRQFRAISRSRIAAGDGRFLCERQSGTARGNCMAVRGNAACSCITRVSVTQFLRGRRGDERHLKAAGFYRRQQIPLLRGRRRRCVRPSR